MWNINKPGNQIGIVIILLVILVGVGLYAIVYNPGTGVIDNLLGELNSQNFPITSPVKENSTKILINQSESIKFKDQYLVTSNDWKVEEGYLGSNIEGIKCSNGATNCPIFIISKGNVRFYISPQKIQTIFEARDNQFEYKDDFSIPSTEGQKIFTSLNVNVYVPSDVGSVESESANVTVENSIQELFGCIKNNLCFSSGVLPSNPEEHKLYTDSFKDLLLSINTN